MEAHHSGCIICGQELSYSDTAMELACHICGKLHHTDVFCPDHHFVCDSCHSLGGQELILEYCSHTDQTDALAMAREIMGMPAIHMHGPEHHYLVPAVLVTAWYNHRGEKSAKIDALAKVRKRAALVPGGFCGFHGACGAGIGTGIFMSIIHDANPLSEGGWQAANLMTAHSLERIALNGGPRCCKRDTFLAITETLEYLRVHLDVELPISEVECVFHPRNAQCLKLNCAFYPSIAERRKTHKSFNSQG